MASAGEGAQERATSHEARLRHVAWLEAEIVRPRPLASAASPPPPIRDPLERAVRQLELLRLPEVPCVAALAEAHRVASEALVHARLREPGAEGEDHRRAREVLRAAMGELAHLTDAQPDPEAVAIRRQALAALRGSGRAHPGLHPSLKELHHAKAYRRLRDAMARLAAESGAPPQPAELLEELRQGFAAARRELGGYGREHIRRDWEQTAARLEPRILVLESDRRWLLGSRSRRRAAELREAWEQTAHVHPDDLAERLASAALAAHQAALRCQRSPGAAGARLFAAEAERVLEEVASVRRVVQRGREGIALLVATLEPQGSKAAKRDRAEPEPQGRAESGEKNRAEAPQTPRKRPRKL